MFCQRRLRIKALPVVFYEDLHLPASRADLEPGAGGMSMTRHVGERLLHDAIDRGLNFSIVAFAFHAAVFEIHLDSGLLL